jgi:hypothetical protein
VRNHRGSDISNLELRGSVGDLGLQCDGIVVFYDSQITIYLCIIREPSILISDIIFTIKKL